MVEQDHGITDALPFSVTELIILFVALNLLYVAGLGFYNLYLHPLRHYPGPKLWAAYRLPFSANAWSGRLPFKFLEFHRHYGHVVRVAPDELIFDEPEAWNDIYALQPGRVQNQRDLHLYGVRNPGDEREIIHANDTVHARLRRIYGPGFSARALEEQEALFVKYSDLLVQELKKALDDSPVQDLTQWYNHATFDLMGEFAFGESFNALHRGGGHFFIRIIMENIRLSFRIAQLDRYGLWGPLHRMLPRSAFKVKDEMEGYVRGLVDRRMARGYDPKSIDIFNTLLRNKDPADQLTPDELNRNALSIVVAGSETTATHLTMITWLLARNPEKLKRVQREVREKFTQSSEIRMKGVNELRYMIAVMTEAFRVLSPGSAAFARIKAEDGLVAGHVVPRGTACGISHYAAYRTECNFTQPTEYIPERWLPNKPSQFANDQVDVLQPFNIGPRGCLGKHIAYAESRMLLAKMLWHFDFELADPEHNFESGLEGYTVWVKPQLMMRLNIVQ